MNHLRWSLAILKNLQKSLIQMVLFIFSLHTVFIFMTIKEWASKEKVTTLAKLHFFSVLQAMNTLGGNLYFLDKAQFKFYLSLSADKQEKFLANFKSYKK